VDKAAKLDNHSSAARPMGLSLPLGTVRLQIREFAVSDLDELNTFVCDTRVTRFMLQAPRDRSEATAYLEQVMGYQNERPRSAWELAVTQSADGVLIGACTLTLMAAGEADLGYMLARRVWKQGLRWRARWSTWVFASCG
jgi:RimJ/RimL family protein N-acetyltransferase